MKLFEHPDFEQAIIRTAEYFPGVRESLIEKDYYVTEVLRIIQNAYGEKIIFKGGTSLSKGWDIIQRFSEDVDIFFDPNAFDPVLGKNAINRELKKLRDSIVTHDGLRFLDSESKTIGGFGRCDYFEYSQKFTREIRNVVLVEVGTASGKEPTELIKIQSYIGQFLHETGVSLGADDENSFNMKLLHFRRTFVEKMFAIHAKVELYKMGGVKIGSYARHYYDLFCLSNLPEVMMMLRSSEYEEIKMDYDKVSRNFFEAQYIPPHKMSFSQSEALFPTGNLNTLLAVEYEEQCRMLCFGKFPEWNQVLQRFKEMKDLL